MNYMLDLNGLILWTSPQKGELESVRGLPFVLNLLIIIINNPIEAGRHWAGKNGQFLASQAI